MGHLFFTPVYFAMPLWEITSNTLLKKSIYCLDFRKEGLGYPSQQVTVTNKVFAQGKVNMDWMVGKDIYKYQ